MFSLQVWAFTAPKLRLKRSQSLAAAELRPGFFRLLFLPQDREKVHRRRYLPSLFLSMVPPFTCLCKKLLHCSDLLSAANSPWNSSLCLGSQAREEENPLWALL